MFNLAVINGRVWVDSRQGTSRVANGGYCGSWSQEPILKLTPKPTFEAADLLAVARQGFAAISSPVTSFRDPFVQSAVERVEIINIDIE